LKNVENMCEKEEATLQKLDEIGGKRPQGTETLQNHISHFTFLKLRDLRVRGNLGSQL